MAEEFADVLLHLACQPLEDPLPGGMVRGCGRLEVKIAEVLFGAKGLAQGFL
jgi:hypothetical protein